ncbi:hypothetical protein [Conexibacter sp. SYSU D00693]|uniref:hypothetical protein n=1 Tax=Conexibacter sp. SYSU D00693 TaxID=2812560 RepID=UPI00196A525D|nr:hypothetical protein [Conexibacter sp. SYSU D00693]
MRELGDGFLIVGVLGVTLQVKSREIPSGDLEKERRWLTKKIAAALKQGQGTIRRMRRAPVELVNMRDRAVTVHGRDLRWLNVVVIDHPEIPNDLTPELHTSDPAVVLLRRDWEFLFDQLKSTHAVASYLERVAGEPHDLGRETARYYELALADADAEPEALDPALIGHGTPVSVPLLPLEPAATSDRRQHVMVRALLEDIAETRLRTIEEGDRVRVLAELDSLPVGQRAGVGTFMLASMAEAHKSQSGVLWKLRSLRSGSGRTHLGFGVCSHPHSEEIQTAFGYWVQLRHYDLQEATSNNELTTVGVLLTPRTDGRRPWDTTMAAVSGRVEFEAEELQAVRAVWPMPGATTEAA